MHGVAADAEDAGALALAAGIDVELPDTLGFGEPLADGCAAASCAEALVDRAARRVLRQKVELGLLDADWTPGTRCRRGRYRPRLARQPRRSPGELAERSVVLLDAGTALPLDRRTDRPAPRHGRRRAVRRRRR